MEIPRHWRLKAQRYRLEGSICPTCSHFSFPPRPVCPQYNTQPTQINTCRLFLSPTTTVISTLNINKDSNALKG